MYIETTNNVYVYIYGTPPRSPSPFLFLCYQVLIFVFLPISLLSCAVFVFLPISLLSSALFLVFLRISLLSGAVPQKQKTKTNKNKQNKKISENYVGCCRVIVLRNCVFSCFLYFPFVLCVFGCLVSLVVFGFVGFLMFGQDGRCKGKIENFGHFQKPSEAIGNFGNFRKQNLSESSEGPRSEPI